MKHCFTRITRKTWKLKVIKYETKSLDNSKMVDIINCLMLIWGDLLTFLVVSFGFTFLFKFTKENINGKLHFLCSENICPIKSFITDCNDTNQYYFDTKLLSSRYNVLATALQTEIFTLQACLGNEEEMVRKSSTNSKTPLYWTFKF